MADYIKRETALELFDEWVEATGALQKGTSYYYECRGCIEDAPAEKVYPVPCRIGDEVFCLRNRNGRKWEIFEGTVSQMYFGEDMRICISSPRAEAEASGAKNSLQRGRRLKRD